MKIDAIKPHYNAGNRKPYDPPAQQPDTQAQALQRYAALSQMLFDALVPFVNSYERNNMLPTDINAPGDHPKYIKTTMDDIRRAQSVLRLIATDIYV